MKDKPECRTAVLKIKLGACLTAPTKRGVADLHEAARLYNIAQNRMIRYWERWAEDTPAAFDLPGDPKCKMAIPKGFSTTLYHHGREAAPHLNSIVVASASNTIMGGHILKRVPWNHQGRAKRVWQALMWHEASRPCFRQQGFAVPNKTAKLSIGPDHATLSVAVWSKLAGRKNTSHVFRIETRQLPRGLKNIVRKVAVGEDDWRFCDSELVYHPSKKRRGKGNWFLHLCYQRPPVNEKHDPARVAELKLLGKEADKPFEIATDGTFPWKIGDVGTVVEAFRRLESRRLAMREKYRDAGSGTKGHGRARIEGAIRPVSRAVKNIMERFVKRVVSEAIRYCRRYDCGTLVFMPPRTREKMAGWLSQHGVDWDWTRFGSLLSHRCWLFGISLVAERPASGEVVQGGPGDARKPKVATGGRIKKSVDVRGGKKKGG